jgi:hypothetical protein
MFYKALLSIENVLVHIWSVALVQTIVGSSHVIVNALPASVDESDMSQFLAMA